jgi:predicted O-methyltransferase YrrM
MEIVRHVSDSLNLAEIRGSKINSEIEKYTGYTGTFTRHFYNLICSIPDTKYLEIGTWYGSSSISALYKNKINATFIDNWSEFNGNKQILVSALEKYKGVSSYSLIESDCWKVDVDSLGMYDVYLYDGAHTYADQYKAIKYYYSKLKKNCIVMIDDWNWKDVRMGTMDAFRDLDAKFLFQKEIILPDSDTAHMPNHRGKNTWWNGIGIFVLDKPSV